MERPIIGVFANLLITEGGSFPGMERAYVNKDYIDAVLLAGGIPIIIPIIEDATAIRRQVELADGILLTGGYDLHPATYGEEPHRNLEFVLPERDNHEIIAVKAAYEMKKPMLGICRGIQTLNVVFGGTLYQDIARTEDCFVQHSQRAQRQAAMHTVEFLGSSRLQGILGVSSLMTNSFHHQAVKNVASGFQVTARAADGIIEAMEMTEEAFIVGVQWHPEMMFRKHPEMLKIFEAFVAASNKGGKAT